MLFSDAVRKGVPAEVILRAAKRYRAENVGNKAQYVAYGDNWLGQRRWEDHQSAVPLMAQSDAVRNMAMFWAKKVKAGVYIAPNAISAEVAACMIRSGLVHEQDFRTAGLRI